MYLGFSVLSTINTPLVQRLERTMHKKIMLWSGKASHNRQGFVDNLPQKGTGPRTETL